MKVATTPELAILDNTMRGIGLEGVTVRDIVLDDMHLSRVKVPCVDHGRADLHITLDHRLGTAAWLLLDRVPTMAGCSDCRHVLMKSFMSEDLVDAFVGAESGRLFVGCAGAPTVATGAAVEALFESLPLLAANGRETCRELRERGLEQESGLLAALSLTDLYDCRSEMVGLSHAMSQSPVFCVERLALPPAPEH